MLSCWCVLAYHLNTTGPLDTLQHITVVTVNVRSKVTTRGDTIHRSREVPPSLRRKTHPSSIRLNLLSPVCTCACCMSRRCVTCGRCCYVRHCPAPAARACARVDGRARHMTAAVCCCRCLNVTTRAVVLSHVTPLQQYR